MVFFHFVLSSSEELQCHARNKYKEKQKREEGQKGEKGQERGERGEKGLNLAFQHNWQNINCP